MPPRVQPKEYPSESEGKAGSSRAANKARNAVAAAAQLELLSKHIHSNGPNDKPRVNPLDFLSLSDEELRKYNKKHSLNLPGPQSLADNILQSEIGKKTYSSKKAAVSLRISKPEYASHVQKHFMLLPCRENEIVASFLYKVKNEDKDFKLMF